MAQRKHLDNFYVVELSDDWNVDVPSWKYPRNLESPRVSSPGFDKDSKTMYICTNMHQEERPTSRSPIPRSRSDFSYVGLSSKEKRWTTDFSLLLPAFSRDSTGYSRLTETPVTLQPKPKKSQATTKLNSSGDSGMLTRNRKEQKDLATATNNSSSHHQTKHPLNNCLAQAPKRHLKPEVNNIRKSPTMDPKILSPAKVPNCTIRKSPTMDPKILNHSSINIRTSPNMGPRATSPAKMQNCIIRKSPTLDPRILNTSNVNIRTSPLPDTTRTNPFIATTSSSIRRSPTLDPKVLSHSRVSNVVSRSPTLDSHLLSRREANRWPPSSETGHLTLNRSPLCANLISQSEVVRSQSLRSLRKSSEKSPSKIRNSESAQSDVTGAVPNYLCEADEEEEDFRRLRHFSVTSKGVINWGDSFRSHSLTCVPSSDLPSFKGGSQWDVASTRSYPMVSSHSQWNCTRPPQRYKVAIMGADEVGKTSLIRQFHTSEYICAFDNTYDVSGDDAITVILNEEESELEFIEHRCPEEEPEDKDTNDNTSSPALNIPFADAHVIIYSVTNRRSFMRALDLVTQVQRVFRKSAILLVGNKSDLVRVRAVTSDEGQTSAKERESLFIETSAAINHQVDELLVSILAQIRVKCAKSEQAAAKWGANHSLSRAKGLIKKFLKKACFQAKSCDNLQRL
ncbi:uncharacterized protein LOC129228403 [Uloborus diversus]|uniref:uncharacterized protein LOC129228403 n=1 Tax=Uloborus diversus TaxID=327109 RepID=UPI00240A0319|nr:uncharacterized protein LOC129228403 [Uloborus diversus]